MGKRIGDKGYLTIVRDLKSGATLFVGKGKKGECLDGFMKKLKSSKANIEFVAVDLLHLLQHGLRLICLIL